MKKIFLLLFNIACFVAAQAQTTYAEAIKQGDDAFTKGQYKIAIDKYFAAEAFDPTKKDIVTGKVKLAFDKIDGLRQDAIDSKKEAVDALQVAQNQKEIADSARIEAQKQQEFAEKSLDETNKQKLRADSALHEAQIQKIKADSNFTNLQELKKTVIGAAYNGGIVFYWNDKTGKHGLIASETDLGEFTWQQAKDTCANLTLNGYSDWRLPNDDELDALYANRNVVGGFALGLYWSSREFTEYKAFCHSFDYAIMADNYNLKTLKYYVRPVRSF